ncbi:MAG: hypothetical protein KTR30_06205 [Saprospiraceae bacterium]|nr:hypothetical protein [Saprospiraceae bacterium]
MFVLIIRLSAQPYPVDAFVRMHPPFSPYLEDWTSPIASPVQLQLWLRDANEQQYPVRLRMSWLGQGIRISTKTDFPQEAIVLDYGVPTELSGAELIAYFDWNNLQLEGIDLHTLYQNGGRLPEGIYNFCVEVLDAQRPNEAPLSNQACTVIQLDLLPPPEILYPSHESQVDALPINFQWIPQHVGGFPVEYSLSLYEKRPGLTPSQILNGTPPIYTINTDNRTHFLYDWDEPPLKHGTSYLVQVEIRDVLEEQHFQAQGKSQVYTFYYGEQVNSTCLLSSPDLQVHLQDDQGFAASWSQIYNSNRYEIELATDSSFTENRSIYHTHSVTDTFVDFSGLLSEHPYYIRVRAAAGECFSGFAQVGPVTLSARCQFKQDSAMIAYRCGLEDQEIALVQSLSFSHLQVGDSIWANQFPVVVTKVMGNGPFSGTAYGKVGFLRQAQVNFELQDIEIDQYCRLRSGQLVVSGTGIKLLDPHALDLLNDILNGLEVLDSWLAHAEEMLTTIDLLLSEVEPYLPQNVINNLVQAQQAAQMAQEAYAAALAAGNPEDIQAAKAALDASVANLKAALKTYKEALLLFLRTWLEVAGQVFAELLQDCLWDQLKTAYQEADNTLRAFIATDKEVALNSLPAFDDNYQNLSSESELVIIESPDSKDSGLFDDLSSQFYQKEMDYLLCQTFERLQTEIQSPEAVAAFQQVLKEINASSLEIIGEAISQDTPSEEIVQQVKELIYLDLQQLIRRSTYPPAITLTTE